MDYGRDINSDWSLNEDGDLILISNEDNIEQAIVNRLTCELNRLDLFYRSYGCLLEQFLGWKKNNSTLEFIKIELGNRLLNDERLDSYTVDAGYNEDGSVLIEITLNPSTSYAHTVNLEASDDGVELLDN